MRDLGLQERLPVGYRDGEIRSAEVAHHGKVNSDNFALATEKRPARPTRGRLGIVDDFVGEDVADVALRDNRADQVPTSEFFHYLFRITFGGDGDGS
jgi:hypothetical protein